MILADSSVWVDHLRRGNADLAALLLADDVVCHPFVFGELACGGIKNRSEVLALLRAIRTLPCAEHDDVLTLIEDRRLHGLGLGWTDAHLLAAALVSGARLWTFDKSLGRCANALGCAHS